MTESNTCVFTLLRGPRKGQPCKQPIMRGGGDYCRRHKNGQVRHTVRRSTIISSSSSSSSSSVFESKEIEREIEDVLDDEDDDKDEYVHSDTEELTREIRRMRVIILVCSDQPYKSFPIFCCLNYHPGRRARCCFG